MLPHFSVLIALLIGLGNYTQPPSDPVFAFAGTVVCTVVFTLLSRWSTQRGMQAVEDNAMALAEAALRWTMSWALIGWLLAIAVFDWGALVHAYVPRIAWLGRYVVVFMPAMVMFCTAWAGLARLEARIILHKGGVAPRPTFWRGVRAGLRRNSIVLAPMFVIVGAFEALWVGGALGVTPLRVAAAWIEAMPLLNVFVTFAIVLGALPFVPRIFARMLKAQPLPDGPLRAMLERAAERIKLKYGDILLWKTPAPNAMVVGFTPRTRRIFLTEGLVDQLPDDELLAVFFHEAGHAKRNHIGQFLLLFFCISLVFHAITEPMAAIGIGPEILVLLQLALLWFVLLGWVSRRFEREADVYGGENATILEPDAPPVPVPGLETTMPRGVALMIRALDRVRRISGRSYSHRHGTIEERMTFLASHGTDPAVREAYARNRRSFNWGVAALVVIAVGATVLQFPTEVAVARSTIELREAVDAYEEALRLREEGDASEQKRWQAALDGFLESARRVEDAPGIRAEALAIESWFAAGDTAWHGLWDGKQARTYFERSLELIGEEDLSARDERLQFKIRIELGRIAAIDGRFADARRYLEQTETPSRYPLMMAELERMDEDRIVRERVRLLEATILGRGGEHDLARAMLSQLTTSKNEHPEWKELRADAQRELDWLATQ